MTIKIDEDRDFDVGEFSLIIFESSGGEIRTIDTFSLMGDLKGPSVMDVHGGVSLEKGFSKKGEGFKRF